MDFTLLFSSERIKHMGETMGKKKDICSYTYEELAEEILRVTKLYGRI